MNLDTAGIELHFLKISPTQAATQIQQPIEIHPATSLG
tara:strand:- start:30 stop:143 length:114 start_codon:yes stop_codon:yes gene_type:complete